MEISDLYLLNEEILSTLQYIILYLQANCVLLAMIFIQRWLMSIFRGRSYD